MDKNKIRAYLFRNTIPTTVMLRAVVVLLVLQLGYIAYMHTVLNEITNNQTNNIDLAEDGYFEEDYDDDMVGGPTPVTPGDYFTQPGQNPNYRGYSHPTFSPENPLFEFVLLAPGKEGNYIKDSGEIVTAGDKTITVDFPAHDPKREASRVEITLDSVKLSRLSGNPDQQRIQADFLISNFGPSDIYVNYGSVVRYRVDGKWYVTNTYDDEDYMYEVSDTAPYVYPYSSDQKYRFSAHIPNDAKEITLVYSPSTAQ